MQHAGTILSGDDFGIRIRARSSTNSAPLRQPGPAQLTQLALHTSGTLVAKKPPISFHVHAARFSFAAVKRVQESPPVLAQLSAARCDPFSPNRCLVCDNAMCQRVMQHID